MLLPTSHGVCLSKAVLLEFLANRLAGFAREKHLHAVFFNVVHDANIDDVYFARDILAVLFDVGEALASDSIQSRFRSTTSAEVLR